MEDQVMITIMSSKMNLQKTNLLKKSSANRNKQTIIIAKGGLSPVNESKDEFEQIRQKATKVCKTDDLLKMMNLEHDNG